MLKIILAAATISALISVSTRAEAQAGAPLAAELAKPLEFAPEEGSPDALDRYDPRNLDVAGVRVGMSPEAAAAALRSGGYRNLYDRAGQLSYQARVQRSWAQKLRTTEPKQATVPDEWDWGKGDERITVKFIALPEGAQVIAVTYSGNSSAIDETEFVAAALAKYGKPSNQNERELRWCKVKAPECEDTHLAEYPLLAAWPVPRTLTLVGNDVRMNAALTERFEADVRLISAPREQPSF